MSGDPKYTGYDCDKCLDPTSRGHRNEERRSALHCGWMDEAEWTAYTGPLTFGPEGVRLRDLGDLGGICPGWLRKQPGVDDALEAFLCLEHHEIPTDNALYQAVLIAESAFRRWQAEQTKKIDAPPPR